MRLVQGQPGCYCPLGWGHAECWCACGWCVCLSSLSTSQLPQESNRKGKCGGKKKHGKRKEREPPGHSEGDIAAARPRPTTHYDEATMRMLLEAMGQDSSGDREGLLARLQPYLEAEAGAHSSLRSAPSSCPCRPHPMHRPAQRSEAFC